MRRSLPWTAMALLSMAAVTSAWGGVEYSIADGHAELALSIDVDETVIFMNTFPVDPGGQYIDQIRVAYGRVGGPAVPNQAPVKIVLYEDANGGSPQDATLLWSGDAVIANPNTDVINPYPVPGILVHGTLVAAVYFKNTFPSPIFITALDTTAPSPFQRSFFGYTGELETMDPANLGAIPPGQFMAQEESGNTGNYRIEARGRAVEEGPGLSVSRGVTPDAIQLSWSGSQPTYTVYRASRSDFSDAVMIAIGVAGPTYDDPVAADGQTWFYRVQ